MRQLESGLAFLSTADLDRIYQASLDILQRVGMRIDDRTLLEALDARGAAVDYAAMSARFPAALLEETTRMVAAEKPAMPPRERIPPAEIK